MTVFFFNIPISVAPNLQEIYLNQNLIHFGLESVLTPYIVFCGATFQPDKKLGFGNNSLTVLDMSWHRIDNEIKDKYDLDIEEGDMLRILNASERFRQF